MIQSRTPCNSMIRIRGVSLIELLVGVTIGLLATLVIMQMYANFEGQKRTSTTGADVQENGMMALATVERDVRMAGNGITDSPIANCSTLYSAYDSGGGSYTVPAPGFTNTGIAAAVITDGGVVAGTNNSDTITLTTAPSSRGAIPTAIREPMPNTAGDLKVTNVVGFTNLQKILVTNGTSCTIMQVTNIQNPAGGSGLFGIVHNNGVTAPYNPSGVITNGTPAWPTYGVGSSVYSLDGFTVRQYSIGASAPTSALRVQELSTPGSSVTPIVADIINMQAEYGVAPVGSQQVNCWTSATGTLCGGANWAAPTSAELKRVKALRVAIVARSALSERPDVAGGSCTTTTVTSAPKTWTGGQAVILTANADWQCYRYKVFHTVIPLRNVIWANL